MSDLSSLPTLQIEWAADHVVVVAMSRPDVANALNTQMGRDLCTFFEGMAADPGEARCIVLTGSGERHFCAGGDLQERTGMSDAAWQAQHAVFERMVRAILNCPVPLVGAINGAAIGGGCEIAACCDFIYAAANARFGLSEVRLGIMPGSGGTQTLPRALGERRAKELILTGRTFDAAQAMEWGLVNEVFQPADLMRAALETAELIAGNAPISVRQAKQSIDRGLQMSLRDGLEFELECYKQTVPTQDRREGVAAFREKRPPVFRGC